MRLQLHSHRNSFFSYVLEGRYKERVASRTEDCGQGMAVFHPAGETHVDIFQDLRCRCLNLHILADPATYAEAVLPFEQRMHFQYSVIESLFRSLYREFRSTDEFSNLVLQGIVTQIIGHAARVRNESAIPRWLTRTMERLGASFHEQVTLTELARDAGVHRVHLIRTFQKFCGCAPGEWLRQLRIASASDLLLTTSVPISQIALQTGFSDQSAFTKVFKKSTGLTPARFRRRRATR